ncbi:MAG: family 20 glycosylhydrolase [Bacteroidales bacterium]|nr:family 20 glycosylhydrolase [Bacteroidales bacterium]
MKTLNLFTGIAAMLLVAACGKNEPSVTWIEGQADENGKAVHEIVLKNIPAGGRVWFARIPQQITMPEDATAEIKFYKGNSYYIDVPQYEGKELSIKYISELLPRKSWAPEGFYLQQDGKQDIAIKAEYKFIEDKTWTEPAAEWFTHTYEVMPADIIPSVKVAEYGDGSVTKPDVSMVKIIVSTQPHPQGWYKISIGQDETSIEASEEDGFYYAHNTYNQLPAQLPPVVIEDWPDIQYRGFMLDVARNFLPKEDVMKLIDMLARYKVNYLHLHFIDDEGWRLEIPELPELTTYASHHALPVEKDGKLWEPEALMPGTSGSIDPAASGTGFYTQEDFKEILRYAWERRIRVLPEMDTPGHSRAAIRAMEAYERRTGDNSYRLSNPADSSKYCSAQHFDDNVLDVEYPGVYKFIECIFDNFIKLYAEAGVPLPAIHVGGDEVPNGAWAGRSRLEMKDLFIRRVMDIARAKGVRLAGWQEITQGIKPETAEALKPMLFLVNAWSTRGKNEQLPYKLANEGYPTCLSNVGNLYIDLVYSDGPDERGLTWGGYVDERKTFALQPFNIYESVRWNDVDTPKDLSNASEGKTLLQNPSNIVGVQVQLWSETYRNFGDFTYNIFPKAIGAFERGWNANPSWPTEEDFRAAWGRFYSILATKEFPLYDAQGLRYKKR